MQISTLLNSMNTTSLWPKYVWKKEHQLNEPVRQLYVEPIDQNSINIKKTREII
jgi:hypothetical protein